MPRRPRSTEPPVAALPFTPPCPPGWFDVLKRWVEQLPGAYWVPYVGLGATFFIIESLIHLPGDGWLASWANPVRALLSMMAVGFLLLMHTLDRLAARCFDAFRPVLRASDLEAQRLRYQLTCMPPRPSLLAALVRRLGGPERADDALPGPGSLRHRRPRRPDQGPTTRRRLRDLHHARLAGLQWLRAGAHLVRYRNSDLSHDSPAPLGEPDLYRIHLGGSPEAGPALPPLPGDGQHGPRPDCRHLPVVRRRPKVLLQPDQPRLRRSHGIPRPGRLPSPPARDSPNPGPGEGTDAARIRPTG